MSAGAIVTLIVVILVLVAAAVGTVEFRARSLRTSLGSEYDRLVREHGTPRAADREARRRRESFRGLQLSDLTPLELDSYATAWADVQGGFVDSPEVALSSGRRLIDTLLDDRGYPSEDVSERLALLSVPHGSAVASYREAQDVAARARTAPAEVSTEEMRVALLKFRGLFDEALEHARATQRTGPVVEAAGHTETEARTGS